MRNKIISSRLSISLSKGTIGEARLILWKIRRKYFYNVFDLQDLPQSAIGISTRIHEIGTTGYKNVFIRVRSFLLVRYEIDDAAYILMNRVKLFLST